VGTPAGWLLVVGAFTLLGLFFSSQVWVDYAYAGQSIPWPRAMAVACAQWYLWAVLTPGIVRVAHRFRLERSTWPRSLLVHLPLGAALAIGTLIAHSALARAITGVARPPFTLLQIHVSFLTYWAIVGVTYAVHYYVSARDRELRAVRLEQQLAAAQLQSLRLQLHPHFLFNTLNAIGALMRDNADAADRMLTRLSDLLRATLETANVQEHSLRREMALLEPYLDIQRTRIGDRLTLEVDLDPGTLDLPVPALLLQPLVENAIKHGIADRSGPGRVAIASRLGSGMFDIVVQDDGPGPAGGPTAGYGLENVRQRLRALHGPAASIALEREPAGGARARVTLPVPMGGSRS
jgi:two-component sensor histidine kinase